MRTRVGFLPSIHNSITAVGIIVVIPELLDTLQVAAAGMFSDTPRGLSHCKTFFSCILQPHDTFQSNLNKVSYLCKLDGAHQHFYTKSSVDNALPCIESTTVLSFLSFHRSSRLLNEFLLDERSERFSFDSAALFSAVVA